MRWMYSQHRRKHQRVINKIFRELNNSLDKDGLFAGRFQVIQERTNFYDYERDWEDKQTYPNEYYMVVYYHFIDNATGKVSRTYYDCVNHLKTSPYFLLQQMTMFINNNAYAIKDILTVSTTGLI